MEPLPSLYYRLAVLLLLACSRVGAHEHRHREQDPKTMKFQSWSFRLSSAGRFLVGETADWSHENVLVPFLYLAAMLGLQPSNNSNVPPRS